MAVASRGRTEHPKKWRERDASPERTVVWTEPKARAAERKVEVVYYLSRNGHLEHPHFMEISLPSGDGLYLRDVINRLDSLRGKGIASMYSWSSKRSYKNGFVWHDLSEDDFIYPTHGLEYILKGSELLRLDSSPKCQDHTASSSTDLGKCLEISNSSRYDSDLPRNFTAWSSLDLNEYKVYKNESTAETASRSMDAGTQTEDRKQRRRAAVAREEERVEIRREEISPPPASSSPETLESLIKADGRPVITAVAPDEEDRTVGSLPSGRIKGPAALMHLISCGSISVKSPGFSLVSHLRGRVLPRSASKESSEGPKENPSLSAIKLEDKEYFSGSLIEMKKKGSDDAGEFPALRRSASYNAERSLKLELVDKEIEGVRARCIPRRLKVMAAARKEGNLPISNGSKKITDEPHEKPNL